MAEKLELLYNIFKKAIDSEREAQKMYKDAISVCEDNKTIKVLEELYKDELRHEEKLMDLYNRLRKELEIVED